MGNELSPHSARLFKFLHSWIVKVWRVRQYLEESGCQGHIKVLEANSCDGQTKFAVCPQGHRTTISAYYVIWDDGRLRLIGHWTTTDEERGMLKWSWVSRKRWGSGTYMSYTGCPKKKRTFRMLLEPQCTGSITICRHTLCQEDDFLVVSY